MLKYYISFLFLFTAGSALAQQARLSGIIADSSGNPVPFASVYVEGNYQSAIANEHGEYWLDLQPGKYRLVYRCIGYSPEEKEIFFTGPAQAYVYLEPEAYKTNLAVPYGKELADAVIRRVIAAKRSFLKENTSFSCDVYTKGVQKLTDAPKRFLGQNISKTLGLDSSRSVILYQSEAQSELYINGKDKKEVLQAFKSAGDRQGFNLNRALDLQVNFYNNLLQWPELSRLSFVSPLADNAFSYYTYNYEGASEINGQTIFKIKVEPKRRLSPAFSGYLYIIKGEWRLYSIDLALTADARIDFVDTLRIKQQFIELKPDIWKPADMTFQFKGRVLGFSFDAYVSGLYSNYQINPDFPENFFSNEIMKVGKDTDNKSTAFWKDSRPVPLTFQEELNYELQADSSSKRYLDSIQRRRNRFKPFRFILAGYEMQNLQKNSSWYFYPMQHAVFYNNIEGWGLNLKARYTKQLSLRRWFEVIPNLRYGFKNNVLNANTEITYLYDTLSHASVTVKGGSDFLDLNNRGNINLFYNTLSSLFEGKNYLKLYRSHFGSIRTQRELVDGLQVTAGAEIARRFPINNPPYPDNALYPDPETGIFPINNAFTLEAKASYTFGQQYTTRPTGKVYEPARFPTIQIDYRTGIPNFFNSAVDYDFISADLFQDKINTGLLGYSSFYLSAGKFLNTKSLYFPDLRHFTGNQTAVYNPLFPNFHFLDYYAFSTNDKYLEGHFEHNFLGMFLSRIPLVRKLKLEEIMGGAFLTQPMKNYKEVYIGLQRLIFRVDYGVSWTSGQKMQHAFRLFYGF